jgi:hypothetical protein
MPEPINPKGSPNSEKSLRAFIAIHILNKKRSRIKQGEINFQEKCCIGARFSRTRITKKNSLSDFRENSDVDSLSHGEKVSKKSQEGLGA